jgi:plastocyanin
MQHNADLEAESMHGGFRMGARATPVVTGLIASLALLPSGLALGADTPAEIALTIEQHRFQPEEIRVKAGAPFVLVITNKDATSEEFESKDLRLEKVIPAGKTLRLRLPALKTGTYGFVGEYHEQTAKGRIVAE